MKASEQPASVVKTVPVLPEDSGSGTKHQASTKSSKAGRLHRRDLWQVAFEKLDDDNKEVLAEQKAVEGANVIQKLKSIAGDKYLEYHQGGKSRSKVREGAEKTLNAIIRFKQFVDAVVVFDLTGYGNNNLRILHVHYTKYLQSIECMDGHIACYTGKHLSYFSIIDKAYK